MANKRPPWKIPDIINPPLRRCIQIEIPDDPQHIAIFWGQLRALSDWQRWEREETKSGTLVAQVWREVVYSIDWSNMSCCPEPTNQFYDENGILQVSFDGGATYEPDTSDPRFNSPLIPPLPGSDGAEKRCTAANNVAGYIHAEADQLIADGSAWNSISGIIATIAAIVVLLLEVGSAGALTPLLIGLAAALLGTGLAAFTAAMTETVYSDLVCIVYCRTPDNGVYADADWQLIKSDVNGAFSGIALKFIADTINAMGVAGLNNASRTGVNLGQPCDTCGCGCGEGCTFDWSGTVYTTKSPVSGDWTFSAADCDSSAAYRCVLNGQYAQIGSIGGVCANQLRYSVARVGGCEITILINGTDTFTDTMTGMATDGTPQVNRVVALPAAMVVNTIKFTCNGGTQIYLRDLEFAICP